MDTTGIIKKRRVIPRWRDVGHTSTHEIRSAFSFEPHTSPTDDALRFYYKIWQKNPTIENAFEVICHAQMSIEKTLAYGPAEQILNDELTRPEIKRLARVVRYGREDESDIPEEASENFGQLTQDKIVKIRQRLINEPGNGLLWLDLSRLQANLGSNKNAALSMKRALGAAPNNRLILRAAVRLFSHLDDPELAHDFLIRSDSVKVDPWVQAAEVVAANLSERSSVSIKLGLASLNSGDFSPIHISELASAIGTEEFISGNKKNAKRLFQKSLALPTDNALAQAFWAHDRLKLEIEPDKLKTDKAFEARANSALEKNQFLAAAQNCFRWAKDEPFLLAPVMQGTFIAASLENDHSLALKIFNFARSTNNQHPNLVNNGVVSLAKLGKIDEAEKEFLALEHLTKGESADPAILATKGLIEFGKKNHAGGQNYYNASVETAVSKKMIDTEFRAKVHWLAEEVDLGKLKENAVLEVIESLDRETNQHKVKISKLGHKVWSAQRSFIIAKLEKYSGGAEDAPKNLIGALRSDSKNQTEKV